MLDYPKLTQFLFEFADRVGVIYTLAQNKPNNIVRVDDEGVHVETNSSKEKFASGKSDLSQLVPTDWVEGSFQILADNGICTRDDLGKYDKRSSFLMAFLAALPFTEVDHAGDKVAVRLKSLTTQDLPEGYNDSMGFLKDEGSELKEKLLKTPFFKMVYDMLGYMDGYNVQQKKETLLEMMYLVVSSSTSGTRIKESVAERRLTNTLRWLEKMELVDSDLNPKYFHLAEPFSSIFGKIENAKWAFQLMNETAKKIGVESEDDPRLSLTHRKDINRFHFNFARWLVLGFRGEKDQFIVIFPLFKEFVLDQLENVDYEQHGEFSQEPGEKQIGLYGFEKSLLDQKDAHFWGAIDETLAYIKERFSNYKGTPYRNSHVPELCEAVLDLSKVDDLLKNGINEQPNETTHFWWVNQGRAYQAQKKGGFLWAPKQGKKGRSFPHHTDLLKANVGDIIFSYSKGQIRDVCEVEQKAEEHPKPKEFFSSDWKEDGYLLKVIYHEIDSQILRDDIPIDWRIEENGPFDKNGDVKMGYFYNASQDFAEKLYQKFGSLFPDAIQDQFSVLTNNEKEQDGLEVPETFDSDKEAVNHIYRYISSKGFYINRTKGF